MSRLASITSGPFLSHLGETPISYSSWIGSADAQTCTPTVFAAEFTAEGTSDILDNKYIPLLGCSASLLAENGLQFCAKLSLAVYKLLGTRKKATSAHYPNGNGGVERVNHTMVQMLAMVVNERQDNWDAHLPHVEFACNNSVSAATGLAPN